MTDQDNLVALGDVSAGDEQHQTDEASLQLKIAEERAPVFSQAEAAIYVRRSVENLRELRKQGKLPNAGTRGRVLYRSADLDKL